MRNATGNRTLPVITLALLVASSVHAQWSRTYGGPTPGEGIHAVRELAGGDFVVAASTDSFGTLTGDGWLIRLDSGGIVQSQRVIGNAAPGGVDGAVVLADGGAVFGSRNVRDIFIKHDATITRVAPDGTVLWTTDITSDPGRFFVNDIVAVSDGTFLGVGQAALSDAGPHVGWLVRLAADGSVMWQQYHGGVIDTDLSFDAGIETSDGGFAVAGWMASAGGQDGFVAKVTSAGSLSWSRTYGGSSQDRFNGIVEVPGGGGYAVVGATDSFTTSGHAGWIVRLASTGARTWHAVLGDAEWGDLEAVTLTGGALVALGRLSQATNDLLAVSFDPISGAVNWQRAYEGTSGDYANDLVPLASGGLMLAAQWGWGFPEEDLWLLSTDSVGLIPGCPLVKDTALATSAPTLTSGSPFLPPYPPIGSDSTGSVVANPSALTTTTQCVQAACPPLRCGTVTQLPDPACGTTTVSVSVAFTGGVPPFSVQWDLTGDTLPDASGNPLVQIFPPGNHDVTALVEDSCPAGRQSCTAPGRVIVHGDQTPTIIAHGPTSFCAAAGESVILDAGTIFLSYQWLRDGADLPGETGQQITATVSGLYSVRVVDGNGCTWTSATLPVNADACAGCPAVICETITVEPAIGCEGTPQTLDVTFNGGTRPFTVAWDLDGDTIAETPGTPVVTTFPVGTTNVTAFVTDSCAPVPETCSISMPIVVNPDLTPTIVPGGPTSFCATDGESVTLDGGAGYALYQWMRGRVDLPGETARQFTTNVSGSYSVRVTDSAGCVWTSGEIVIDADACSPCFSPVTCDAIIVDPPTACEGVSQSVALSFGGGFAPITVTWDLDGDTVAETSGNPVSSIFPVGTTTITAFAIDSCPGVPSSCQLSADVDVRAGTPPGEVSDVVAGAVPLLVTEHGARVSFEDRADAVAYNVHADAIGSWYAPNPGAGSACFVTTMPDGAGRLAATPTLAMNTWLVVTASSDCQEGSAGTDSNGVERTTVGTWTLCGAP